MNILEQICEKKRAHVETKKILVPLELLREKIVSIAPARGFISSLKASKNQALIAEVKKASPSKGIIRADFNPIEIAKIYENSGAACISVLTDEPYFSGHDDYLVEVKKAVKIPILRKDFIIDSYQIYESMALGADCILLIMAALSDESAREFYSIANDLGMDVLVEIHDKLELDRAIKINPAMIGVNNRDLKTLKVDIETSFNLLPLMPQNILKVSESGISSPENIEKLSNIGFNAFLVGESLMRETDIAMAMKKLLKAST